MACSRAHAATRAWIHVSREGACCLVCCDAAASLVAVGLARWAGAEGRRQPTTFWTPPRGVLGLACLQDELTSLESTFQSAAVPPGVGPVGDMTRAALILEQSAWEELLGSWPSQPWRGG